MDAPPNAGRRERSLIDPVAHRLLVELEDLGDVGDSQKRVREVALFGGHFLSN